MFLYYMNEYQCYFYLRHYDGINVIYVQFGFLVNITCITVVKFCLIVPFF